MLSWFYVACWSDMDGLLRRWCFRRIGSGLGRRVVVVVTWKTRAKAYSRHCLAPNEDWEVTLLDRRGAGVSELAAKAQGVVTIVLQVVLAIARRQRLVELPI